MKLKSRKNIDASTEETVSDDVKKLSDDGSMNVHQEDVDVDSLS